LGTPIVVVLNDNGMSIAPNVGALSRYFNRIRLEPGLWKAREEMEEKLTRLPAGIGAAFEAERPVVVHCATVKGKGFAPAEQGGLEGMEKWHAAKPNSIAKRMPA